MSRCAPARALRWVRAALTALLAGVVLGAAAPRAAFLLQLASGPFTACAADPEPLLALGLAAAGIGGALVLLREAAGGPRPGSPWFGVLVLAAVLAAGSRPPGACLDRSAALLATARSAIRAGGLAQAAQVPLPATDIRDRRGRRLPARVRRLPDRAGPVLHGLPGDPPGTLYAAIAPGARSGWLTGLTVARDGSPTIVTAGGAPLVLGLGQEGP